jgi:hypothetical protein
MLLKSRIEIILRPARGEVEKSQRQKLSFRLTVSVQKHWATQMRSRENTPATIAKPKGRLPMAELSVADQAADVLHSHLIIGFEEALNLGMTPMVALGSILTWVASEMTRIPSELPSMIEQIDR